VYSFRSLPELINCTIVENIGTLGGGVYCDETSFALTNCILWNAGSELVVAAGTPELDHCAIQGGWPGMSNIPNPPQLVDAALWEVIKACYAWDLRLYYNRTADKDHEPEVAGV
jgi:hypothetical protein